MAIEQQPPDNSDYRIEVSVGPPEGEVSDRPQRPEQPAAQDAPAQPGAEQALQPEQLIDLEADPYGEGFTGESEMVAGKRPMGMIIDKLVSIFGKEAPPPREEPTMGGGGGEAPPPGETPAGAAPDDDQLPIGPVREGQHLRRQPPRLGSTGPTPQPKYFEHPEAAKMLELVQSYGKRAAPVSWDSVQAQADVEEIGMLIGKEPALGWTTPQLRAMVETLQAQSARVAKMGDDLQRQIDDPELPPPSAEQLSRMDAEMELLLHLQDTASEVGSSAAKLLNILRKPVGSDRERMKNIQSQLRRAGGEDVVLAKVAAVAQAARAPSNNTAAAVNKAVRRTWRQRRARDIVMLRYNSMLSNPRTHFSNFMGSLITSHMEEGLMRPLTYFNQRLVNIGHKAVGSNAVIEDLAPIDPLRTQWASYTESWLSGARLFNDIIWGRDVSERFQKTGQGKLQSEMGSRYLPDEEWGADYNNAAVKKALKYASFPTRNLEATDGLFRAFAFSRELHALAKQRAWVEANGDMAEFDRLRALYVENPTEDMIEEARAYGQKITFTNNPDIYGKFIGSAAQAAKHLQQNHWTFQTIMPFINTPANLIAYTIENMSGGVLAGQTYRQIISKDPKQQAKALARIEMSIGLFVLSLYLYENDYITGTGPADYRKRQLLMDTGWQPESVRLNLGGDDYWGTVNRLDPGASIFTLWATYFDMILDGQDGSGSVAAQSTGAVDAFVGTVLTIGDLMGDRTFLRGIVDAAAAFGANDPDAKIRKGADLTASTIASFYPNLVRVPTELMSDGYKKDLRADPTAGLVDRTIARTKSFIKSRTPVLESSMPPAVDWKGNYKPRSLFKPLTAFVPTIIQKRQGKLHDDVPSIVLVKNEAIPAPAPDLVNATKSNGNVKINLMAIDPSGVVYAWYAMRMGQQRYNLVRNFVESNQYFELRESGQEGDDSVTQGILRQHLNTGRRVATAELRQALATPGFVFKIPGDYSFTLPDDMVINGGDLVAAYEWGQPIDHPGVYYKPRKTTVIPSILERRIDALGADIGFNQ